MSTDERLRRLEQRVEVLETLLRRLVTTTPAPAPGQPAAPAAAPVTSAAAAPSGATAWYRPQAGSRVSR